MGKLTAFLLLMVLVNLSWADVTTSDTPLQDTTLEVAVSENEGESHNGDSTVVPVVETRPGSEENTEDQTEAAEPVENDTCSAVGIQAHHSNCQLYRECSSAGSADGSLRIVTKSCPERQAFNTIIMRCSRDISSCNPPVQCSSKGAIADPESDASYYLCQPYFIGSGFHVFRVYCGKNEVFHPSLGICLVDLHSVWTNGLTGTSDSLDIIEVKREIQQWKELSKEVIRKENERKKAEEKLKKKQEKEAEQAKKLQEKARKAEADSFKCETEGNFPSQIADNVYIACINRKTKITAIPLECSLGAIFVSQTGTCEKSNPNAE